MQPPLVQLIALADDANLGQTLLRLARLAASMHVDEVAQAMRRESAAPGDRVNGITRQPVENPERRQAVGGPGSARTEVGR